MPRNEIQQQMMQILQSMFGEVQMSHSGADVVLSVQNQYYGCGRTIGEAADDLLASLDRSGAHLTRAACQ